MSKKVISILLSAAMLVAMLCIGVGSVTASADTVTYYFLAPDAYFATNDSVGVYYWQPSEVAPWPGTQATPAPEVGKNVFKVEAPDSDETATIIFNAYVDAGNPADPALAAVAHQTININTEGYDKGESEIYETLDNFYGMIYVLANDADHQSENEFSGAITTSGEWFSIDPSSEYYYKNFDAYYGTYGFEDETPADNTDTDAPVASDKDYHAGDEVKVALLFGGVDNAGTLTTFINFDKDYLQYTGEKVKLDGVTGTVLANDNLDAAEGNDSTIKVGAVFDPEGNEHAFAGDKVAIFTFTFTALKDFNVDELGLSYVTTEITQIIDDGNDTVVVLDNYYQDPAIAATDKWTELGVEVKSNYVEPSKPEEPSSKPEEPSSKPEEPSSKPEEPSSQIPSKDESKTSSTSSTESKATGDSASSKTSSTSTTSTKTTSTSTTTTSTAATVQTAGTFAVVSLVVILMAAAAVVLYTRKKTEE